MSIPFGNFLSVFYMQILSAIGSIRQSILNKDTNQQQKLFAGPLVFIVVVIGVVFVAWALGQTLCWATTGKDFVFATKLKAGEFRLGCQ